MHAYLKKYEKQLVAFVRRLRDIKFAGQVLFVIIVLLISWSGVKAIQANYELQKQISALKQQKQVQALTDKNLALENGYYKTDTYLNLSARQNFGLANPGEKELIVPESVAMSYTIKPPKSVSSVPPQAKQPTYQRNFQSWVNLFLHRQNTEN